MGDHLYHKACLCTVCKKDGLCLVLFRKGFWKQAVLRQTLATTDRRSYLELTYILLELAGFSHYPFDFTMPFVAVFNW